MTGQGNSTSERQKLWAKRSAVHYLGTYASSVENLRRVMARRAANRFKGIELDEATSLAEEAVQFCIANGFLSDSAYAETKVASGLRKGQSRRKIAAALAEKGVDPDTAASALGEADDLASAVIFARRKSLGPWRKGEPDPKTRQREAASFGRNGFSGETAFRVISMPLEEAEDIIYASRTKP